MPAYSYGTASGCNSECQELARNISSNNPLIALSYLFAPIVGLVVFIEWKGKPNRVSSGQHQSLAKLLYTLALISLILLLLL